MRFNERELYAAGLQSRLRELDQERTEIENLLVRLSTTTSVVSETRLKAKWSQVKSGIQIDETEPPYSSRTPGNEGLLITLLMNSGGTMRGKELKPASGLTDGTYSGALRRLMDAGRVKRTGVTSNITYQLTGKRGK